MLTLEQIEEIVNCSRESGDSPGDLVRRIEAAIRAQGSHTAEASADESSLRTVTDDLMHWRSAQKRFLNAWKAGVAIAGYRFFGDGTPDGLKLAASKEDLSPNFQLVKASVSTMSRGERAFLVAMLSFYNGRAAHDLWEEVSDQPDNIGWTISGLDLGRRQVLAELTLTYTGW